MGGDWGLEMMSKLVTILQFVSPEVESWAWQTPEFVVKSIKYTVMQKEHHLEKNVKQISVICLVGI